MSVRDYDPESSHDANATTLAPAESRLLPRRNSQRSLAARLHDCAQEPLASWLAVVAAAVLLVMRKPWALTTPQLWAEDGSVHLEGNDDWGAHALFVPYRGYLHLLPRLIAWSASRLVDVAYWPAFYNWAAFLVTVALFARLASSRFNLPGKPWLILSFVLAAHTGEVWFNITNLHWLTAFFLVSQVLIARPVTGVQRIGDLAILVIVGLTGPFIVVFLPLLAWRWWRDRNGDNLTVLLVAAACAAVQLYFIKTGSRFEPQAPTLNLELLLAVVGSRLVVWPFFGERMAALLPWSVLGALGITFILALVSWGLRAHERRSLRLPVIGAFFAIGGVCLWRIRPDTWAYPDLVNGDSYFYVARILLVWLLVWEFDARCRAVAWSARALAALGLALQVPHYQVPAPPDYHWEEYCDAIRRGEPALIPTLPDGYIFRYHGRPGHSPLQPPLAAFGPPATPGRLINFSVRAQLTADEPTFTFGAALGGVGTHGTASLVIRAMGPSLVPLGIADTLPDPTLSVLSGATEIAANDDWGIGDVGALTAALQHVGAFAFAGDTSRDAAVALTTEVTTLASPNYTMRVGGKGATGTVLAEVYDAAPEASVTPVTPRLINFSVLKRVRGGDDATIGFVIGGQKNKTLLLRAVGPTLRSGFGIADAMAAPQIELFDAAHHLVGSNGGWRGAAKLVKSFKAVGAFELPADSKDAALVVTLKPGSYSAQIGGRDGAAGSVLTEIYEVP